ncbi:G-patch domain-containing protein [Cryptosporidium muris RN66]|uniref:G-patch domain-containing protein n=1 Tax=Cryptosporidium muris (strain RN66) TaxID=441375 RepID=B6AGZ5_CRYMR|nr:G-patch domain-containing protein [Cryptosporidium muris RN66]EEA07486.1 G-patch domain-containing protein [Cryptosporidium muris RN66]|eukprot:XP_002141835.1 G-patch domain-containing protein [Cryptosporidium muris RN66]
MNDLYDGLPPASSQSNFQECSLIKLDWNIVEENSEIYKINSESPDNITIYKESLNNDCKIPKEDTSEQYIDKTDLINITPSTEYDPTVPNIYDDIAQRSNEIKSSYIINNNNINSSMSIGQKLMERMGWKQGQGLGKDEQGITVPLIAKKLNKQSGIIICDTKTK